MKKLLLICSIFLLGSQIVNAQLAAGDIAFLGYNTDSGPGSSTDHSFAFITLTDTPGSEVIYFTEEGWNDDSNTWAGTTEGHITWTAPAGGLSCGTVVYITESGSDVFTVTGGGTATLSSGLNWNLSGGDQVLAYQAAAPEPATTPTFISGLNGEDGAGSSIDPITLWNDPSAGPLGPSRSGLPAGLTNGTDCVSLFIEPLTEQDNAKYTGTLTGTSTALRALINDRTNWSFHNTTAFDITPSGYSPSVTCVTACSAPDLPTVTYSPVTVCNGNNATLTISGSLNDATAWHVYTESCGGTSVGTTAGTTISVTPTFPSTTYYVRGEGECTTPGSCGSVAVTVTPLDNASFSYSTAAYCVNGTDPTPTITGVTGGKFSSTAGLSINASTGAIDVSASTPSTYMVTYTTEGFCPNSYNVSVTITQVDVSTTLSNKTITANAVGAIYQWLDCNNGNSAIAGETNNTYTATTSGSYAVRVTQNGCSDTSDCVEIHTTTLSLTSNSFSNEIKIYPNPTNNNFEILFKKNQKELKVNIYSSLGQLIQTRIFDNSKRILMNLNQPSGIYFVECIDDQGNKSMSKLIKK